MRLRWGLSAIGALFFAASASAQTTFNQIVVFGDSSVDSGYYRQLPNPNNSSNQAQNNAWVAAVAAGAGAPTNGFGFGVLSDDLARDLGLTLAPANTPGGTNFATGGAKNQTVNTDATGGFRAAVPVANQVSNYLASVGNNLNRNALYLVDSGGNDIAFALGKQGTTPPSDPTSYINNAALNLTTSILRLHNLGAQFFVIPLQSASFPMGSGADAQAARNAKLTYNRELVSGVGFLRSLGGGTYILADVNSVRLSIAQNPAAYGFQFIGSSPDQTVCSKPDATLYPFAQSGWAYWCSPTSPISSWQGTSTDSRPDLHRLFADDQHLSTAGQQIEADYIHNLITAPQEIAVLAENAIKTRLQLTSDIQTQIGLSMSQRGQQGINAWVSGNLGSITIDEYHDQAGSIAAGIDYAISPSLIAGLALSSGRLIIHEDALSRFKQEEQSASLYAAYNLGSLWGNVIGSYGHIDYDSNRIAPIGISLQSNTGSTSGENWSAAVQGGYKFSTFGLTHGPVAGYVYQHLNVDGFTESGSYTSLRWDTQKRDSSISQLGYRANFDYGRFHPFAQVLWNHEFADASPVTASLTTIAAPSYTLPPVALGRDWGNASAGLSVDLGDGVKAFGKGTADFGQSGATVYGGQIGLNVAF